MKTLLKKKKNVFCFVLNLQQHQNVKVSCLLRDLQAKYYRVNLSSVIYSKSYDQIKLNYNCI